MQISTEESPLSKVEHWSNDEHCFILNTTPHFSGTAESRLIQRERSLISSITGATTRRKD
ncbi:hypothetical protein [Cerasicoccus frondis]|uniref:hypothetical protein n=1 Tax=Cerasicoccus frondis TaxID=490090 RepID=UPI002852A9E2|nr:hypothetical protein [Cerasicoccus frondis]